MRNSIVARSLISKGTVRPILCSTLSWLRASSNTHELAFLLKEFSDSDLNI